MANPARNPLHSDLKIKTKRLPANVPEQYSIFLDMLRDNTENLKLKDVVVEALDLFVKKHPEYRELAEQAVRQAEENVPSNQEEKLRAEMAKIEEKLNKLKGGSNAKS